MRIWVAKHSSLVLEAHDSLQGLKRMHSSSGSLGWCWRRNTTFSGMTKLLWFIVSYALTMKRQDAVPSSEILCTHSMANTVLCLMPSNLTPTPCCVSTTSLLYCHITYFVFQTDISDKNVFTSYDLLGNGEGSAITGLPNHFRRYYTLLISYNELKFLWKQNVHTE
jgi:hypothetical protein